MASRAPLSARPGMAEPGCCTMEGCLRGLFTGGCGLTAPPLEPLASRALTPPSAAADGPPLSRCAGEGRRWRPSVATFPWEAAPPATLRRPNHPLPLLPSGPGGIYGLSSRRHRRSHHGTRDVAQKETARHILSGRRDRDCSAHPVWVAERAGFEPAKRFDPLTHFPGVLLQPLGHLSTSLHRAGLFGSS